MITIVRGRISLIFASSSMPSMPGMRRSVSTTSGSTFSSSCRPARASCARATS